MIHHDLNKEIQSRRAILGLIFFIYPLLSSEKCHKNMLKPPKAPFSFFNSRRKNVSLFLFPIIQKVNLYYLFFLQTSMKRLHMATLGYSTSPFPRFMWKSALITHLCGHPLRRGHSPKQGDREAESWLLTSGRL